MELRFRHTGGNREHGRDLVMLVAFDVVQHEDLARAVGQLHERRLEVHREIPRSQGRRDLIEDRVAVDKPLPPRAPAPQTPGRRVASLRKRSMSTFTVSRWSQVPKAESPRNVLSFCQTRTKTSC